MTVIVLSKHGKYYHLHCDGRAVRGDSVSSDKCAKLYEIRGAIFGLCGYLSDVVPITDLLEKDLEPIKVLRKLRSDKYKDLFHGSEILVASKKYGPYMVHAGVEGTSSVCTWKDHDLPLLSGSGRIAVGALLAQHEPSELTPDLIKSHILTAYKVCNSIGGEIKTLKLKI